MGVDLVIESTGLFTDADKAAGHLKGGASKVIISAPAKGEDLTLVLGVNDEMYDADKHNIISNASCTTNCFATMVKVLNDSFGIEYGLMSTIHSYTNDQAILDQRHSDLRRARAAAENIIPTSTGAARAVGLVLPELNGKLNGVAFRVPTATGSITDFTAMVSKDVTIEEINEAYIKASEGRMNGILEFSDEPLVSSDYKGNPHSCIIDGLSTMVMEKRMVKVMGWYDNEWGYSCRTADLAAMMAEKGI
jgi:glyceraldehyde 3-phosphate dehydrogenase